MNITIQGVEITLTPEQLQRIISEGKPTKEELFWKLFDGVSLRFYPTQFPHTIYFFNGERVIGEYRIKTGSIYVDYETIWSVFENEYHHDFRGSTKNYTNHI